MKYVPASHDIEIVKDTTKAENMKRAKRRMDNICANESEIYLYGYDPQGARDNDHPGIPLDGYGEKFR